MKLATISISTPRIITRLPSPLKLASCYSYHANNAIGRKMVHKPLLVTGESSDGSSRDSHSKVPKGCMAVYVEPQLRRFVIPISFLAMPEFRVLLDSVAEEFGCDHHGALEIPCDEDHFELILMACSARQRITSSKNSKKLGKMRVIYV